jgi:phosphoenolpyruvate carboxykinase (ATP)
VPDEVLNPRNTWADQDAYDCKARELAALFVKNFEQFKAHTTPEVIDAGPRV